MGLDQPLGPRSRPKDKDHTSLTSIVSRQQEEGDDSVTVELINTDSCRFILNKHYLMRIVKSHEAKPRALLVLR